MIRGREVLATAGRWTAAVMIAVLGGVLVAEGANDVLSGPGTPCIEKPTDPNGICDKPQVGSGHEGLIPEDGGLLGIVEVIGGAALLGTGFVISRPQEAFRQR